MAVATLRWYLSEVPVERKCISLPGRIIKRLGEYEASLRLHREVVIQFPFEIVPDKSK